MGAYRHLLFDSKGLCRIYNSLVERDERGLGRSRLKILTPELKQESAGSRRELVAWTPGTGGNSDSDSGSGKRRGFCHALLCHREEREL